MQDCSGRVLDKWCVASYEEELIVLQQFLRFGETKAIAQEIIFQDMKDQHEVLIKQTPTPDSNIKKFIQRSNLSSQNYIKSYNSTQVYGNRPVSLTPPANRVMQASFLTSCYSPGRKVVLPLAQAPVGSSTPLTAPLNLFGMIQHFDDSKIHPDPAINLSIGTLDKTSALISTTCDNPQDLTVTTTSVSSASPSLQNLQQLQQHSMTEAEGSTHYSSQSSDEVHDYSRRDSPDPPADEDRKSKQHLRGNPVKRQWQAAGNFINTSTLPNSKKRVPCTSCNKTFCDKGALKIHNSAVHLKEMHKCTVEGCNMMFSSRRSRNRHSANPNPKLHLPQEKKDEEMDGSLNNESFTSVSPSAPTKFISSMSPAAPFPTQIIPILDSPHTVRDGHIFLEERDSRFTLPTPPGKRVKLKDDHPMDMSKLMAVSSPIEEPRDLSRRFNNETKLEIDQKVCSDESADIRSDEEKELNENEFMNDVWGAKLGRRRKNAIPTRCAQNRDIQTYNKDNSSVEASKTKSPLLDYKGQIVLGNEKSGVYSHENNRNAKICILERKDTEGKQGKVQDLSCTYSPQDKMLEESQAINCPKIASLLSAGNANTKTVCAGKDLCLSQSETEAGGSFENDNESSEWNIPNVAEDDVSESSSLEQSKILSSSDDMQEYLSDTCMDDEHSKIHVCKICNKSFTDIFSMQVHFQNIHLKVIHPHTTDGFSAILTSKEGHQDNENVHLHQIIHSKEVHTDLRSNKQTILSSQDVADFCAPVPNAGNSNYKSNSNNEEQNKKSFPCKYNHKVSSFSARNCLKSTCEQGVNGHRCNLGSTNLGVNIR